jgi:hypothetical protein
VAISSFTSLSHPSMSAWVAPGKFNRAIRVPAWSQKADVK